MRHRNAEKRLGMTTSHRQAVFRNMATSLFKYGRIRTTEARAKELRSIADKMVTLAKQGNLHARRQVMAVLREKDVVHQLFAEAPSRFGDRAGGYTRITKIGRRPGDCASMTYIELLGESTASKKPESRKKGKDKPSETAASSQTQETQSAEPETVIRIEGPPEPKKPVEPEKPQESEAKNP